MRHSQKLTKQMTDIFHVLGWQKALLRNEHQLKVKSSLSHCHSLSLGFKNQKGMQVATDVEILGPLRKNKIDICAIVLSIYYVVNVLKIARTNANLLVQEET